MEADKQRSTLVKVFKSLGLPKGFTTVPNFLSKHPAALGLNPNQVAIVHLILAHWWGGDLPFVSVKKIAEGVGLSVRTVQYEIKALTKAKLLSVDVRSKVPEAKLANVFDLTPLLKRIAELQKAQPVKVEAPAAAATPSTPIAQLKPTPAAEPASPKPIEPQEPKPEWAKPRKLAPLPPEQPRFTLHPVTHPRPPLTPAEREELLASNRVHGAPTMVPKISGAIDMETAAANAKIRQQQAEYAQEAA